MDFKDKKIALVSGYTHHLPLRLAQKLAHERVHVLLALEENETEKLREAGKIDGIGKNIKIIPIDYNSQESLDQLREQLESDFGKLDILITESKLEGDSSAPVKSDPKAGLLKMLQSNLMQAWQLTKNMVPILKRSGQGRIVNIYSDTEESETTGKGNPVYDLSKAAFSTLNIKLAAELHRNGILVNAVQTEVGRTDSIPSEARVISELNHIIWAALLPAKGPTGNYYRNGEIIEF